jgi:adenylate kinase
LDGFPRTTEQASGLDEVLRKAGRAVDSVVLFEAPDEVLVQRLSGRRSCPECGSVYNVFFGPPAQDGVCDRCSGELVQRKDDEPDTVRRRLQVYLDQTAPLVDFYAGHPAGLIRIQADRDVDDIYAEFTRAAGGSA